MPRSQNSLLLNLMLSTQWHCFYCRLCMSRHHLLLSNWNDSLIATATSCKNVANRLARILPIKQPLISNITRQSNLPMPSIARSWLVSMRHPCLPSYVFNSPSQGAFFNGVFLLALALSIFLQSIERFVHIEVIEQPFMVLIIGCVGLALNSISAFVIHGTTFVKVKHRILLMGIHTRPSWWTRGTLTWTIGSYDYAQTSLNFRSCSGADCACHFNLLQ